MNFIDNFILNENLSDLVLENADFSDIGLGILLGNLEKIKRISPNFCSNLSKSTSVDPFSKTVLLGRVFQILSENSIELHHKYSQAGAEIVENFVEATDIVFSLLSQLNLLRPYIQEIYNRSFLVVIDKLALNDCVRRVVVAGYGLKDEFCLVCNFFYFDYEELKYLEDFKNFDPEYSIQIVRKGYGIMKTFNIPRNDAMSIVVFGELQNLLDYLEKSRIHKYNDQIERLVYEIRPNFSEKQQERIDEKMSFMNQNYHRPEPRQPPYKNYKEGRDYSNHSYTRNLKYKDGYRRNNKNFDRDSDSQIRASILNILEDLRNNYKNHIDIGVLITQLEPLIIESEETVYYYLEHFSYNEQYYSTKSITVWGSICDALEEIKFFNREKYRKIVYNTEHIKRNQDRFD